MSARNDAKPRAAAERVRSDGTGSRLRAWREQHLYSLVSSLGRLAARPFATGLTVGVMAIALALALGGLAIIFYVLTIVKMGPALFDRAL